jgi:hypothetical protein
MKTYVTRSRTLSVRRTDLPRGEQLLFIGPTADGTLLELVAVPADGPTRIVHANVLQAKQYKHLRR